MGSGPPIWGMGGGNVGTSGPHGKRLGVGQGAIELQPGSTTISVDITDYDADGAEGSSSDTLPIIGQAPNLTGNFQDTSATFDSAPAKAPFVANGTAAQQFDSDAAPIASGVDAFEGDWKFDNWTGSNTGRFIAGQPTPFADMSSLKTGGVTATYTGTGISNYSKPVSMNVNFGASTWSGTFGYKVKTYGGLVSGYSLTGADADFTANGAVSGADFRSTSVSADSGSVNGTFYGANAAHAGGRFDVKVGGVRYADVFKATKGSPAP
uniref:Transferrin-binding protein B C-lobe/N-lobe beta-barrel domain-containing protein n=1 Tax=Candidatus Kentrum sp. UNK TaxID=2126344 RepID=A0A451A0W6_9GAMM|nr:MAG: hypothetical protein BECKUNK1418G_GA0071005_100826 [Candidatus Kentron sp. UNK]VFK68802.1 MAG: hypothetical protein BECKUNK1418H_GA0071006_100629 [Candidatus Kentron sp. UNK]